MLNFCKKKVVLTQCYLDVSDNSESNELYIFDHFFYTLTTPPYLVQPGTLKFFANLLQKMDFLEISYLEVSENLQQYEPILIFSKKFASRGSHPCPTPPPAH